MAAQLAPENWDIDPQWSLSVPEPAMLFGDARSLPLADSVVDLVVTSPPYWRKRNYRVPGQVGQEESPSEYVQSLIDALSDWRRVLRPSGSIFFNVGDSYHRHSLAGIPGLLEHAATKDGWFIRNRIIWAKPGGMPDPARDRLVSRHEYIIHLAPRRDYYYDLEGYSNAYGNGANPGDVWLFAPERNLGAHLAPFPRELVSRAVLAACPSRICAQCNEPSRRIVSRTSRLDTSRPQARRALELAHEARLTDDHIAAIQATGISDAGKAMSNQTGTGKNSARVRALAAEAKLALGGYFREFTFAKRETSGWTDCGHQEWIPGVVLDPFAGTGTTLNAAFELGRTAVGFDLDVSHWNKDRVH